jgi:hypothetical protein
VYPRAVRLRIVLLLAWLSAAPAVAGPVPLSGELGFALGGEDPVVFPSGPMSGPLSGSLRSGVGLSVPGGTFVGTMRPPLDAPPATGLQISVSNGPGVFAGAPLGAGTPLNGTMPVAGAYGITGFGGMTLFRLPFTSMSAGGAAAAGLGIGGTVMWASEMGGVTVQGTFGPWTSGTATVMSVRTPSGTGTVTQHGFATPGAFQLVTPIRISSSLAEPTHAFVTVTYDLAVPEPAVTLLLGTGSAVLAGAALRRRSGTKSDRP